MSIEIKTPVNGKTSSAIAKLKDGKTLSVNIGRVGKYQLSCSEIGTTSEIVESLFYN